MSEELRLDTPRGPAQVSVEHSPGTPRCLVVLTHGAGGGVDAVDLAALAAAVRRHGAMVAAVTQPYRVAGRRAPGGSPSPQDEAWRSVVQQLRAQPGLGAVPLVVGGRSNGARVVCRTAADLGASAVVALAFPLHPPGKPERSRDAELRLGRVPRLVVNGGSDPFGVPEADAGTTVVTRRGERHDLSRDPDAVAELVVGWLAERALVDAVSR